MEEASDDSQSIMYGNHFVNMQGHAAVLKVTWWLLGGLEWIDFLRKLAGIIPL